MKKIILFVTFICSVDFINAQWQVIGTQEKSTTSGYDDGRVFFINDTLGYGLFNKTADGGNNWQRMNGVEGGAHIYFSNEQIGHRVHNTNTGPPAYERTLDGGNSWEERSAALPTNPYGYYDVFFPTTATGYIVNNGRVFKTTDTGNTWATKYQNANFITTSLYFSTTETGYITGYHTPAPYNSNILITKNGGNTWDSIPLPFYSGNHVVVASDTDNVYVIAGYSGQIIHSADGGYNWVQQFSDSSKTLWDIFFSSKDTGYAVGANYESGADTGLVLKTTNSGNNWLVQPTGYNKIMRDCHFISADIGWIAGGNGEVLYTTNGGGTVGIQNTTTPFNSQLKIYPNPTTGKISLQFAQANPHQGESVLWWTSFGGSTKGSQQKNNKYNLEIYNILGEVVYYSIIQSPTHSVIDLSKESKGIYFVKVQSADKVVMRKIIIQ